MWNQYAYVRLCMLGVLMLGQTLLHAKTAYILVHGYWGKKGRWHKPNGKFRVALTQSIQDEDATVLSFEWSGGGNHEDRLQAARDLAELINNFDPDTIINIIAHSHGANVVILASHIIDLEKTNHAYRINALHALGAPVDTKRYLPNMDAIGYVYNFFSHGDKIQQVCGKYARLYPAHERIANLRIFLNGRQPGHLDIHSSHVARWIPHMHHKLADASIGNFETFSCELPGTVCFSSNQEPCYHYGVYKRKHTRKSRRCRQVSYADL